ncbi:MAG: helix-turn-helix domain-containing protein [Pseudomonadota bacterium]
MIGLRSKTQDDAPGEQQRGFDDFELRLGDVMRGERATMGKSLLDVERDLRIKASYIAAIENCDPDAFDTPGFIPGYVRSYARYLLMDPDEAFAGFCRESGFAIAHGMSADASSVRRPQERAAQLSSRSQGFNGMSGAPYLPARESIFSRIEPGALGSLLVLVCLITGLGYGAWSVLNEVQRVQFAPVENTPNVLSNLDPLQGAVVAPAADAPNGLALAGADADAPSKDITDPARLAVASPGDDRLDRLFRPEALDVPVLLARDAPISTLDPAQGGAFAPKLPSTDRSSIDLALAAATPDATADAPLPVGQASSPQVLGAQPTPVRVVAVRPAWVRVRAADGTVIFEGIMNAGDAYDVPVTEEPPTLRVGESGAIYFSLDGQHYGPVGETGTVTANLALAADILADNLAIADLSEDADLSRYVAELQTSTASEQ